MTKRIVVILLIISFLLIVSYIYYVYQYNTNAKKQEQKSTYMLHAQVKNKIQDGDIILRNGFGWISDKISAHLNETFNISHCGIIRKKETSLQVLHSESSSILSNEGVQLQNLDDFTKTSKKNSIIILRLKKITSSQIKKMDQLIDLYVKQDIKFDYKFDSKDSIKMFCTELVWNIYKNATHTKIFIGKNNKPNLLQFNSLYQNPNLKIIINQQLTNKKAF